MPLILLTSFERSPSKLKSRRGLTVASFIDKNWNKRAKKHFSFFIGRRFFYKKKGDNEHTKDK